MHQVKNISCNTDPGSFWTFFQKLSSEMLLSLNNASLRIFWTTTHRLIRDYELTIVMKLTLNGGLSLYVALGWTRIYHVGHSMTTTVDKLFPLVVAGSSPPRLC